MGGSVAYTQWRDPVHVAYLRNIAPTDTLAQMPTRDNIGSIDVLDRIEAILSSREPRLTCNGHATTGERITHPWNETPTLAKDKHHHCIVICFALIGCSQQHCVFQPM